MIENIGASASGPGSSPVGTGAGQAVSALSGNDPSRSTLGIREQAIAAAQIAIAENLLDADVSSLHYPAVAAFDAVIATLKSSAAAGRGGWCFGAARRAQVIRQEIVWALGGSDFSLGDDDVFVACLDAINAQAIEARRAATTGAVEDESAVGSADASKPSISTPSSDRMGS